MDTIIALPLDAIAADALPRDRSDLDPDALDELQASIARDGLHQPIEVWQLSTPMQGGQTHGLISGLRRLTAHQNLNRLRPGAHARIPAFIRTPGSIAEAMAAMISENEIRADLSPWDRGRILVQSVTEGIFPSVEDATLALHPNATRQKRAELRDLAQVVEALDGLVVTPHALSNRNMLHLSAALRGGLVNQIRQILQDHRHQSLDDQWLALLPAMAEPDPTPPSARRSSGRAAREPRVRKGLVIRRELSKDGWRLCFSGPDARSGAVIDEVMDKIELLLQPNFTP